MKRVLFVSVLLSSSFANAGLNLDYRAYNTPVNYNFAEINVSHHSYELDNKDDDFDTTIISAASEVMLDESMIVGYSISHEKMVDVAFSDDSISLIGMQLALLHRTALAEKTDLVFGGGIELTWLALEINDETDYSHQDTALGAKIGVRHGFTERFEGGIQVHVSHSPDVTNTDTIAKLTYYANDNFGLGGFYSAGFNDEFDDTEIGGYVRFRF